MKKRIVNNFRSKSTFYSQLVIRLLSCVINENEIASGAGDAVGEALMGTTPKQDAPRN